MARFRADEAENYGGQGGGGFFGIQKNKGVKQVRFMYDSIADVEGMSVHKIKLDGKDRYVNCLRAYNEPVDNCPFCREKMAPLAKLFIPVYNIDEDAVQIWDRGKTMFEKMSSLCSRYAKKCHLVNNIFEVERHGEPNDKKTTYEIYQIDEDDTELADLPELPEILGKLVLDKTADDMEYYLEEGDFPPTDDDAEDEAPRRRGRDAEGVRDAEELPPSRRRDGSSERTSGRRTPASSRRDKSNEDDF